ncbi:uncharacterized protein C2845_PM05G03540 [Panicum miliaceum]|uniref:Uncharacterized protein n=1 Tax=Panicum miliaceum TaxID=4540 RepID=A0A3L6T2E9_PANMI|nr:uncharacterized protein C2845_PM05G03540 [Panicum miliaceum]
MSNFRVLCMFRLDGITQATMFTVDSSWSNKNIGDITPSLQWPDFLGRAGGSRYFCIEGRILVELDGSTDDSSPSVLPAIEESYQRCKYFVTEGRDGKPRFVTVFNNTMKVLAKFHSGEWALENSVLLSEATRGLPGYQPSFFIYGQDILTRVCRTVAPYSIDLETMEAEPTTGDMGPMEYRKQGPSSGSGWAPVARWMGAG